MRFCFQFGKYFCAVTGWYNFKIFAFQVREEKEETQKAIDDLQWRSDLVSKKIQETCDATKVVLKIQRQTDDNIADLT